MYIPNYVVLIFLATLWINASERFSGPCDMACRTVVAPFYAAIVATVCGFLMLIVRLRGSVYLTAVTMVLVTLVSAIIGCVHVHSVCIEHCAKLVN